MGAGYGRVRRSIKWGYDNRDTVPEGAGSRAFVGNSATVQGMSCDSAKDTVSYRNPGDSSTWLHQHLLLIVFSFSLGRPGSEQAHA